MDLDLSLDKNLSNKIHKMQMMTSRRRVRLLKRLEEKACSLKLNEFPTRLNFSRLGRVSFLASSLSLISCLRSEAEFLCRI